MIQKIGIWGFGIVGKSALNFFHPQGAHIEVLDNRPLTADEQQFLDNKNIASFGTQDLADFLERNDVIIPSPGIDLRAYTQFKHKWIAELDIFGQQFHKPIIAITGSIGKTSVTHLLSLLLHKHGMQLLTGGNIGIGMLDLVAQPADAALLELSSFQLELCSTFAPNLAIWTNLHPNHLDRHGTLESYFNAKHNILAHQKTGQKALIPLALAQSHTLSTAGALYLFASEQPTPQQCTFVDAYAQGLFYLNDAGVMQYTHNNHTLLIAREQIPHSSYVENWLILAAALTLMELPLTLITEHAHNLAVPEHRLEKVTTVNGVEFYNDSKSTTPASTLAAVKKLSGKPTRLFLGGMGKGVDRTPLIEQLKHDITHIYCFGKEAEMLHEMCAKTGIPSSCAQTLEEAFTQCTAAMQPGEQVLLSPAGSSYDLFKNYEERGKRFKELVLGLGS